MADGTTHYAEKVGDTQHGLIIIRNVNGPKLDCYRKRIPNTLKLLGFKITINTNLKIVNFLDVTLNLKKSTFECYKKKKNDTPMYIHTSSNHSPSIIKLNQLAADYPVILPRSIFSSKRNTYMTTH